MERDATMAEKRAGILQLACTVALRDGVMRRIFFRTDRISALLERAFIHQ
jgi:hypothetical protein